jgi:copper homeostasis protein
MARAPLIEAAVDTFEDAIAAETEGVDRIELCGPLHDGGTTPSAELLARCLARLRTPIHVLLRPRAGDFVYAAMEIARMQADIEAVRRAGAAGVVTGALTATGAIDVAAMAELVAEARPMRVGCHRAFDQVRDQFESLEALVLLGVDLILTSGAAPTALEGADRLRALVERAGDRIGIIAAGSITAANVADLIVRTGVRQVHGRKFRGLPSAIPTR